MPPIINQGDNLSAMNKDENLLPCPFCGEAGSVNVEHAPYARWAPNYWVSCDECGASAPLMDTETEAIAAWNTRTTPIADEGLAEKMRGLLIGAVLQLEYLDERFPTGTTPGVIAQINHALEASSLPLGGGKK